MIHLTTFQGSKAVAINPKQVLYVKEEAQGCSIVFDKEITLHVANNYLEVVGSISAHS